MIDKHVFAPGMQKDIYEIQADEKIRLKCHSNAETYMIYNLEISDTEDLPEGGFVPATLFVDSESTIVSHKYQASGTVHVRNTGPGVLHLWVYSGDSYGAA